MKKMRKWIIVGFDGLSGDFGLSEPGWAAEEIRSRQTVGENLSERDIEDIAYKHYCRVEWEDEA